ncbi:MAG: type II toxin-antitoxin system HicA family toxin [Oscillospiraceae bacterium]|nr:type II toxin-antitoxin system HicA family toxin [Oscillospiraceae bacterium]
MSQYEKLIQSVLSGRQDRNILFSDICSILERSGFAYRVRGDHFIFTKDGIEEIINIQPIGNKAKPYQVKQIREIILKYRLGGDDNEQV